MSRHRKNLARGKESGKQRMKNARGQASGSHFYTQRKGREGSRLLSSFTESHIINTSHVLGGGVLILCGSAVMMLWEWVNRMVTCAKIW